jgi:integrase
MQHGSLIRSSRKRGPDVWQFRWADKGPFGKRIYRRRVIGTVCQYPDAEAARKSVAGLLRELNANALQRCHLPMTIAELCDHFIQRELSKENSWRSYSTKKAYKAYLNRWVIPQLGQRASFGGKNHGSRVMAAQFASGEEQLCENPRFSLGPF